MPSYLNFSTPQPVTSPARAGRRRSRGAGRDQLARLVAAGSTARPPEAILPGTSAAGIATARRDCREPPPCHRIGRGPRRDFEVQRVREFVFGRLVLLAAIQRNSAIDVRLARALILGLRERIARRQVVVGNGGVVMPGGVLRPRPEEQRPRIRRDPAARPDSSVAIAPAASPASSCAPPNSVYAALKSIGGDSRCRSGGVGRHATCASHSSTARRYAAAASAYLRSRNASLPATQFVHAVADGGNSRAAVSISSRRSASAAEPLASDLHHRVAALRRHHRNRALVQRRLPPRDPSLPERPPPTAQQRPAPGKPTGAAPPDASSQHRVPPGPSRRPPGRTRLPPAGTSPAPA